MEHSLKFAHYHQEMVVAVKELRTSNWGSFFFAMPGIPMGSGLVPSGVDQAEAARVLIPNSDITFSTTPFGDQSWHDYGVIGINTYKGVLIPLSVVREINPEFDYCKILKHGVRRPEYEEMVINNIKTIKAAIFRRG